MKTKTKWLSVLVLLMSLSGCGGGGGSPSGISVQPSQPSQPSGGTTVPSTTATPAGGLYSSAQSVVLQASPSAPIYYTTDGSTPGTGSALYTAPISIAADADLKFFAMDSLGNRESVKTEHYSIAPPVVPPVLPPVLPPVVLPVAVTLRVSLTGVSQALSGIKATLTLPTGVTVATTTPAGGVPAASVVVASGLLPAATAAFMPESLSWDAASRKLSFILYSTAPGGFLPGEFASVACLVSGSTPAAAAFSGVLEPVSLLGAALPLAGVGAGFLLVP